MSFYPNNTSFSQFPQPIQTRPTSTPSAGAGGSDYPPGSMSFINLNIDEYRVQDLEAFFMLPTKNYDIQDVVHKKKTMCAAANRVEADTKNYFARLRVK
jgi:hypothetical protein